MSARLPDPDQGFRIGRLYTYRWDGGFEATEQYQGQTMLILGEADDYDKSEVGFMYAVLFPDGVKQDVFLDEIGAALEASGDEEERAFLAHRPHYGEEHVHLLADSAFRDNVPFCWECKDWHPTDQEHSTIG